jgi:hypothetical protein
MRVTHKATCQVKSSQVKFLHAVLRRHVHVCQNFDVSPLDGSPPSSPPTPFHHDDHELAPCVRGSVAPLAGAHSIGFRTGMHRVCVPAPPVLIACEKRTKSGKRAHRSRRSQSACEIPKMTINFIRQRGFSRAAFANRDAPTFPLCPCCAPDSARLTLAHPPLRSAQTARTLSLSLS